MSAFFPQEKEQKYWPCEHITKNKYSERWEWKSSQIVHEEYMYCEYCGAKRPDSPKDWLMDLLEPDVIPSRTESRYKANKIRQYIKENRPKENCLPAKCCDTCDRDKLWFKFLGVGE